MLEAELKESSKNFNSSSVVKTVFERQTASVPDVMEKKEIDIVSVTMDVINYPL